jgi:hypothetical protein
MTTILTPSISAERLYPSDIALMARTDLSQTRLLGFEAWNLDSITNIFLGLLNGRASVRHVSGANDEILALFERAGVPITESLHLYESGEEAEQLADALIEAGKRLVFLYPLREGRFADAAYLVAPQLWRRLNSKSHLARLVPSANLAPRALLTRQEAELQNFERPVFVKDASNEASGAGWAVRACFNEEDWRRSLGELGAMGVTELVVEDALDVERCWCAALAVEEEEATFIGAAEQVFGTPGKHSGNVIDPEWPLPAEGAELARLVGERARQEGFRGVAGLDIGRTTDGRLIVFDPNFRINSSSAQVLFHDAACRRAGLTVSLAVHVSSALPFKEAARRLVGPIDDGWFVPTRILDAGRLGGAPAQSSYRGFVLAGDRAGARAAEQSLTDLLSAS